MENNLTQWFVYEWEKPIRQKPYRVILRSPFPRIHYYHNKQLQVKESQYLIPTYSWTLTPIPNWTCFVVPISHFQCTTPNTWLTNCVHPRALLDHQLEKYVGCKVLLFITWWRSWNCLVTKLYGVQTQQLLQEKEELEQTRFPITPFFTLVELCSCATCVTFFSPQNNSYICLRLWEKKAQTYIHRLDWNQLWKTEFHKSRWIAIYRANCWATSFSSLLDRC